MTRKAITYKAPGGPRFTLTENGYVLIESETDVPVAVSVYDYDTNQPTVTTLPQLRGWATSWLADGAA